MRCFVLLLWSGIFTGAVLGAADNEAGSKSLFNGRDLSGWDGDPRFWSARDGTITGQTTRENPLKGNTFLVWRGGTVEDFELRLSYRIVGGNSGIQYRSKDLGNWVVGGYQADLEAGKKYTGILYEERGRGILAERGQKTVIDASGKVNVVGSVGNSDEILAAIKQADWNDYVVVAQGNHMVHRINGRVTVDVTDEQTEKRVMSGILALQLHAGEPMLIQFKDIRLKRLKPEGTKRLVLVAGTPSHSPGEHEFNAGVTLLKKCLDPLTGVQTGVYLNGWPKDPTAFDSADTILLYMDGGEGHPIIQGDHLKIVGDLMKKGVGLACVHYAVEVPKNKGGPDFLQWMGGYFETFWSVNPHWEADFKELPRHPITRGVKPFKIKDEWYYHMRFRENMKDVTPILTAIPPDSTRSQPDGSHSGNPDVRAHKGMPEHVAWAFERPGGGRGFGFTGAHFHKNWGNDSFRKLVLNALLWTAKMEVPPAGVQSKVTAAELEKHLDLKPAK